MTTKTPSALVFTILSVIVGAVIGFFGFSYLFDAWESGGTVSSCPPGTEVSKVTWVGTCRNPANGRDYLISYNDCCGATMCGQCFCNRNERERPAYRMGVHNDINWCMSNTSNTYHCTVAAIVGVGDPKG